MTNRVNKYPIGYMRGLIAIGASNCLLDGPTRLDESALEDAGFTRHAVGEEATAAFCVYVRGDRQIAFRFVPACF